MILLAGDFCQTLPMIPWSMPVDELNACLSPLFCGKTKFKQEYLCRIAK